MLDHLIAWLAQLGPWGYLVVFTVVLLECQAVIGFFLPGESLVLLCGFLANQGVFDPWLLTAVTIAAAIIGDGIGYLVGRRLGRGWLLTRGARFGLRREHVRRVDGFLARHGAWAVAGSRYMHLLRVLTPFMAGAARMPYLRFAWSNALGVITWTALFVTLGHLAGDAWRQVSHWIGIGSELLVGGALVTVLVVWLVRRRRRRAAESNPPPAAPDTEP